MARPGRWSRTWTGILAPVRSRKSPCPAAGLRKVSLLVVVLALQVLGLPVPDHVFGVAIPVATTGFPQPVRPLCYDEGVLVRVCSRIGGRPHLAARRGGGAGRASAQGPGVPAGLLAAPGPTGACADGGRRSAVLAHLGAGVARGRWAFGCGGPGIARSKPSAPPTRATRCSTRATPAWTPTARRPARTGWSSNVLQRPPARRTPRRAGRQASVAAAGGGRPAPALPPGRVEATHAPGFANGRRVAERLGIDLADPAADLARNAAA